MDEAVNVTLQCMVETNDFVPELSPQIQVRWSKYQAPGDVSPTVNHEVRGDEFKSNTNGTYLYTCSFKASRSKSGLYSCTVIDFPSMWSSNKTQVEIEGRVNLTSYNH